MDSGSGDFSDYFGNFGGFGGGNNQFRNNTSANSYETLKLNVTLEILNN